MLAILVKNTDGFYISYLYPLSNLVSFRSSKINLMVWVQQNYNHAAKEVPFLFLFYLIGKYMLFDSDRVLLKE